MKSNEILDRVFAEITRKEAARRFRLSQNLINKWCISSESSALNPLDRVQDTLRICAEEERMDLAQMILDFISKPLIGQKIKICKKQK